MTVDADQVTGWAKLPTLEGDDLVLMEKVIAAVTSHIVTRFVVHDPMTDVEEMAVLIQAARLWRRRETPEGVIAFDELGAVRVGRVDPDVAEMLTPRYGIA